MELVTLVERPEWLSGQYLLLALRGQEGAKLDYQRQAILRRFLKETEGDTDALSLRIRGVRMLAHFPTVAALRYLERIVSERRLFRFKEPLELRQAAQSVLDGFAEEGDGDDV